MRAALELVKIGKSFPCVTLADVDLTLQPGTIHALVGKTAQIGTFFGNVPFVPNSDVK